MNQPTIEQIKKAINVCSYEHTGEDRILIKVDYLLVLKRYIDGLELENQRLKKELKFSQGEVKRLTGRLIECQNKQPINFDIYM